MTDLFIDTAVILDFLTDRKTFSPASGFPDFEDSIQYFSAIENRKIDIIITRNTKDYKKSGISVMTPGDYLKTTQSY
jgi:hypothetical protein